MKHAYVKKSTLIYTRTHSTKRRVGVEGEKKQSAKKLYNRRINSDYTVQCYWRMNNKKEHARTHTKATTTEWKSGITLRVWWWMFVHAMVTQQQQQQQHHGNIALWKSVLRTKRRHKPHNWIIVMIALPNTLYIYRMKKKIYTRIWRFVFAFQHETIRG